MSVSRHLIYALTDPRDGYVRYVGKSSKGMRRPKEHFSPSRYLDKSTKLECWIYSLAKLGLKPNIKILEECTKSNLNEEECFYISYMRFLGCDLCNHTDGVVGADQATIQKIKAHRKMQVFSMETREKMRLAKLGKKQTAEHVANRTKTCKGRKIIRTDEQKTLLSANLSIARRGKRKGPQSREHVANKVLANPLRRPIRDNFGVEYISAGNAAKTLNLTRGAIQNNLLGISKMVAKKYIFSYLECI